MSEPVLYELDGATAWVTLNRPEARNAMNRASRDALWAAFERFEADDAARVLVLTGAGDRAFCAGGDLKEMAETSLAVPPPDFVPQLNVNLHVTKPTIAAVNGVAYAGGFLLAQMCDLCVAVEGAQFGITEPRWGRGAPWAAPLSRMIPMRIAMELLITARPISAERAYDVGLVNHVVAPDQLRPFVAELAADIAKLAPLSVAAGRAMLYRTAAATSWAELVAIGDELYRPAYESADAAEGPRAFREGRAPEWTGA